MKEVLINIDWNTINDYVERDLLITNKHPELDLWILNYSKTCQFEKAWDLVTLSCRGLIVDKESNIVARPFTKFFNKEELETEGYMDLSNIGKIPYDLDFEAFEKMDGSFGTLFHYEGEWIFASRGSFESEQAIKGGEILNNLIGNNFKWLNENCTHVFEILYPENRIVVSYGDTEDLVLLGVIVTETGEEIPYNEMKILYDKHFTIIEKCDVGNDISKLKELEEDNKEGFVVRFSNGFRLKVKFDEYCRLHRIVTNVSNKTIWESLKNNEGLGEVLERVPDEFYRWVRYTEKELRDSYTAIELEMLKTYAGIIREVIDGTGIKLTVHNKADYKKEFALKAKDDKYSGLLFSLYNGKDYSKKIWKMIKPEWSTPFRDGYEESSKCEFCGMSDGIHRADCYLMSRL